MIGSTLVNELLEHSDLLFCDDILLTELEVFSIFKLYWDIGILGTVQACTVLNIAKLRMLE